ncbi:dephospho-CoA kinase [Paenibacillus mendelii]|uniref:Dephospho-CoA kinase n=1 Tax=Paenibacillus mendelii TaxID=206163 RepID=A0ABV6JAE9_9BACL|nr:dephospho-CoA kinase [Paenibacillus mendelii]MCQ6559880.1 dephospho-CoA kinase [Paenibacillus mendelii]
MKLGLTGGIASGKSTVSAMLVKLGAKLVDADQVAREVVLPGEPALEQVVARFGQAVLNEDGTLNRSKLGSLVFTPDKQNLKDLEAILHPAIRARMQERMDAYLKEDPNLLVIADIPLLYETNQAGLYDAVMVVYVPPEKQLQRLMEREGLTEEESLMRIKLQMDINEKKRLANYVIDNSGSLEDTTRQVGQFWREHEFS